jgi:hypothetical protein
VAISLYPADWLFAIFKVLTGEHPTLEKQQISVAKTAGLVGVLSAVAAMGIIAILAAQSTKGPAINLGK